MQEGLKCRYLEDDSSSIKVPCFVALAFLLVDDVVGYEQLVNDEGILQLTVFYFENNYIRPSRGQRKRRLGLPFLLP